MFSVNQLLKRGALLTDVTLKKNYEVGQQVVDEKGNVYEYVKTANAETISIYDCLIFLAAGSQQIDTTNDAAGARCGFACAAVTGVTSTPQYLWCLVKTGAAQVTSVRVLASCAAAITLQSTSTPGVLDDTDTIPIYGITLGTAQGGAAGTNATAQVRYPFYAEVAAA